MHILLDLIVIVIVAIVTMATIKKGFVRSVLGLASLVITILLISTFGKLIANTVYNVCIEKGVVSAVESTLGGDSATREATVEDIFEALPPYIANSAAKSGINTETITAALDTGAPAHSIAVTVNEQVVEPLVLPMLLVLIDIILFSLLMIIFRFITKLICPLFKAPILNQANKFLGAVLGIIKGVVIAALVCSLINFIIEYYSIDNVVFSKESIENSYIFGKLSNILDLTSFIS